MLPKKVTKPQISLLRPSVISVRVAAWEPMLLWQRSSLLSENLYMWKFSLSINLLYIINLIVDPNIVFYIDEWLSSSKSPQNLIDCFYISFRPWWFNVSSHICHLRLATILQLGMARSFWARHTSQWSSGSPSSNHRWWQPNSDNGQLKVYRGFDILDGHPLYKSSLR